MSEEFKRRIKEFQESEEFMKLTDEANMKICKQYAMAHKYKKPITIKPAGRWANGKVYACTCGLFKSKRYCFYMQDGEIVNVRER